ncbi:hypothetical protein BDF20DRAFT_911658 [Mycotypha africana]|uniref:uncharacterized protein n=1 Tax=Mycotypha africana TaxID=64632 RepID=UPI0023003A14|nr:uncharacterized protein BDF20DRAFT_911658 [Mycotypha africana]KAI8984573.1 hypothetical protein BDF20DRAFT_911658 [Mycotypha africana]
MDKEVIVNPQKCHLDDFYEYHVYDNGASSSYYDDYYYGPCPLLIMYRHQGFRFNDEMLVSEYRRHSSYESHKSTSLEDMDHRRNELQQQQYPHLEQSSTSNRRSFDNSYNNEGVKRYYHTGGTRLPSTPDVIDIKLTKAECDVYP